MKNHDFMEQLILLNKLKISKEIKNILESICRFD